MSEIITITDIILSHSDNISRLIIVAAIVAAIVVATTEYKEKAWSYITNRRNKWKFVLLAFLLVFIVIAQQRQLITGLSLICVSGIWFLSGIIYVLSLKPKRFTGFTDVVLRRYEKWLYEGGAMERVDFFEKPKPWYLFTIEDSIEYHMLACQYYIDVNDYGKAYKELEFIKEDYLYDNEKKTVQLQKTLLLTLMGNLKAALELLGNPENNESKNPMVWNAYSFCYEKTGDVDKALEYAEKARSIVDAGYDEPAFVTAEVYNNYARVAIFKGNRQEALHYLDIAWEKVKKSKDMRTVHIIASNRIIQMAIIGRSRTECETALQDYYNLIHKQHYMNRVQYNNCAILMYRQFEDAEKEIELIKSGYFDIVKDLKPDQAIMFTATTFRMLINGHFDHSWFDEHVCKRIDDYMAMPFTGRLTVFKEYMSFYSQEEFKALYSRGPYLGLQKKIMKYYRENAIQEIDDALLKVDGRNTYMYMNLMLHKLGILKLIEGKKHINNSKDIYVDLYNHIYDSGLHLDAVNVLMTLIDECTSAYNVLVRAPHLPGAVYYIDLLESVKNIPEPSLTSDGIHLSYPRFVLPEPFVITPLQDDVIREHIDTVICEFRKWKNHPFKIELSIEIAHILMCLERNEEAKEFYLYFKNSGISEMQMASWAREDLSAMKKDLGMNQ